MLLLMKGELVFILTISAILPCHSGVDTDDSNSHCHYGTMVARVQVTAKVGYHFV